MKLKHDELLSNFALNFNLRPYVLAIDNAAYELDPPFEPSTFKYSAVVPFESTTVNVSAVSMMGGPVLVNGRGFHSSTSQLNLSHSVSETTEPLIHFSARPEPFCQ